MEFPWLYLFTSAVVELGKDEDWFWNTEPRILISILDEYREIKKENMKAQGAYISCCVWGKDPDELEGKPKEIAGIDKPVDPEMLKGFM